MRHEYSSPTPSSLCDELSRNNLATHALLSILCASLSPFSAGLNLGVILVRLGASPGRRQQAEYITIMLHTEFSMARGPPLIVV